MEAQLVEHPAYYLLDRISNLNITVISFQIDTIQPRLKQTFWILQELLGSFSEQGEVKYFQDIEKFVAFRVLSGHSALVMTDWVARFPENGDLQIASLASEIASMLLIEYLHKIKIYFSVGVLT